MTHSSALRSIAAIALFAAPAAALAGEIKGPPPTENYTGNTIEVHGRSACAFSGLNDSPEGDSVLDPGGLVQSFGAFFSSRGFPVRSLDPRKDFLSPGFGCNPNRGEDRHG